VVVDVFGVYQNVCLLVFGMSVGTDTGFVEAVAIHGVIVVWDVMMSLFPLSEVEL
jgi:hypothetical protein